MKNLLIIVIPFLICLFVCILAGIIVFAKKIKFYIWIDIILIIVVVGSGIYLLPYFRDITSSKTGEFTGVYTDYIPQGNVIFCSKNTFQSENTTISVYIPKFTYVQYNLQEGNVYKVTYFLNTYVVCNIEACK